MAGCDLMFTTCNYGVTTTPRKEYEISTGLRACPDQDLRDKKHRRVRIIQPLAELKGLKTCREAKLKEIEMLAVVGAMEAASVKSPRLRRGAASNLASLLRPGVSMQLERE